jgi:hypothetical protein
MQLNFAIAAYIKLELVSRQDIPRFMEKGGV